MSVMLSLGGSGGLALQLKVTRGKASLETFHQLYLCVCVFVCLVCLFVCLFVLSDRARVIFKERVNKVACIKADSKVSAYLVWCWQSSLAKSLLASGGHI